MELQEALLSEVLGKRGTASQQAFEKPAQVGVEILKQHSELVVFTCHKLRYTT
jgi:hypothetical protein